MEVISNIRVPKIFSPTVLIRDTSKGTPRADIEEQTTNLTFPLHGLEAPGKFYTCGACSCVARLKIPEGPEYFERPIMPLQSSAYEHMNTCLRPTWHHQRECQPQCYPVWHWSCEGPQDLRLSSSPGSPLTSSWDSAGSDKSSSSDDVPKGIREYSKTNRLQHKGKTKLFKCPYCDISCSNRGQLLGHIRIHTGERPFACQEPGCDKSFIRNEELTRHRRIHTGERPYVCETCKKAFTRKDHLNKHLKIHTTSEEFFTA